MLDARMIYSCAYWRHAQTLEAAQKPSWIWYAASWGYGPA
jgi:cyclopropane fatty-acyl-phospholipid synthase-like methyltransferase